MTRKIRAIQNGLGPALRPLGKAYAWLMRKRAAGYAGESAFFGPLEVYRPGVPVLSVGNIAWGGAGKTPLTLWLGRWFKARGENPVVLSRGYGGRPARLPLAVNPHSLPEEAGDEPVLLARGGLSVVVDPRRSRGAAWAEAHLEPDLLIMDDGFQHLALARDLDLLALTPEDLRGGWGRVIPAGTWREGPSALARASAFLLNAEPETLAGLQREIALTLLPLEKPVFAFHLQPLGLRLVGAYRPLPTGAGGGPPVDRANGLARDLAGAPYALATGVGSPERVANSAERLLGYAPEKRVVFPDHHHYSRADAGRLAQLRESGLEIVCTGKDAVKLGELAEFPLWVLEGWPVFEPALDGRAWEDWLAEVWAGLAERNGHGL